MAVLATLASTTADARQIALVIGNAAYERTQPLRNPKRDAGAMADRFRDLGFTVIEAFDADTAAMAKAVDRFIDMAHNADFAAFYFAGHGVQLFDRNILLGRDADPATVRSGSDLGIDLAALARRLREAGPVRSALIIDACRDNPFAFDQTVALMRRVGEADGAGGGGGQSASLGAAAQSARGQRGLAAVTPPSGATGAGETLFMFAAQPGMVSFDGEGQNSYFVEGLRGALAKPGQPLSKVLQEASAYVRTATRGGQVPQVVSDWTGDVVLGRTETVKVRFLTNSRKPGGAPLSAEESRAIGETARPLQRLSGTFIVQDRQQFGGGDAFLETSPDKRRRAAALGSVNGFAIDYDLDRDGRLETIAAYFRQVEVYLEVVDEGVSKLEPVCGRDAKVGTDDHDPVTAVEIALRDLDGDRRPEIIVHYTTEKGGWGEFCILQYVGDVLLAPDARGALVDVRSERSAFRMLLRGGGETVLFGADNTIATCSGSNCHTRNVWSFDGKLFRLTLDQSEPPEPAAAQPFADEADRAAKLAAWTGSRGRDSGVAGGMDRVAPSSPGDQAAVRKRFEAEVEAFVVERYLKDGQSDGRIGLSYGENITYYGAYMPRAKLLADKAAYYARWPERSYRLTPGSLGVTGDASGSDVTFTYSFAVANAGKRSIGKGRTTLRIRKEAGEFLILQEAGEVLKP